MTISPSPLFTSAQREQFTRFPELAEQTLVRHSLLDGTDLRLVRERRRDFNKLGYAVQLTVLRHLGRALRPGETPPEEVLGFLAEQLRVEWLRDPELRRRVLVGLNKGEASHALKRVVAFHGSREIRDRSFEAQSNRARD